MIIPIRCFTCGKVLANKWNHYQTMLDNEYSESAAFEALGITRYCCRRMLISHVDFIHKILTFTPPQESIRTEQPELTGPSVFRSARNTYGFNIDEALTMPSNEEGSVLEDEGSPRYETERSHTELQVRTSNTTSSISRSQSFIPDAGSPRYAPNEFSPKYSQIEESPRYSHVTNDDSPGYVSSPTYLFEYEDSSPRYTPSSSPEPSQNILTYQRNQTENSFSGYLPHDEDSPRYSPCDL